MAPDDTNESVHTMVNAAPWHIPRPSLSGSSSGGSVGGDARSRGGSASSQGSASNHSTHSVSSGSLLLSAARLARVHGGAQGEERRSTCRSSASGCGSGSECDGRPRAHAVVAIPEETDTFWNGVKRGSAQPDDAASVASSTHFTVVNGFTKHRPVKEPRTCCCRHSHQITVLVISMTILFSACILAAICFVEMRMRKETGIYRYS